MSSRHAVARALANGSESVCSDIVVRTPPRGGLSGLSVRGTHWRVHARARACGVEVGTASRVGVMGRRDGAIFVWVVLHWLRIPFHSWMCGL
jgi:hypothetical protein